MKQGEIGYLNAIGRDGRRHAMNKPFSDPRCGGYLIAMGQIMDLLPAPPARVLDCGCGTGWTSVMLARRGYDVLGLDISPDMIECALQLRQQEGLQNLNFEVGDYESIGTDETFDAVVFFDALHHAEDEKSALSSAYNVLREDGICVASEPGRGHSRSAASIAAVERFGVNEKDMAPSYVGAVAKQLGFKAVAYPHMSQLARLLSADHLSISGSPWKRWLVNQPIFRPVLAFLLIVYLKRDNGVTVLIK